MRAIFYVIQVSIAALLLFSCETLEKTISVSNRTDIPLLVMNKNVNAFDPYCYMYCIDRIEPDNTAVNTVENYLYGVYMIINVYRDLFENRDDKDTLSDCEKKKELLDKGFIKDITYTYKELKKKDFTIVLDSITLGLKIPEK